MSEYREREYQYKTNKKNPQPPIEKPYQESAYSTQEKLNKSVDNQLSSSFQASGGLLPKIDTQQNLQQQNQNFFSTTPQRHQQSNNGYFESSRSTEPQPPSQNPMVIQPIYVYVPYQYTGSPTQQSAWSQYSQYPPISPFNQGIQIQNSQQPYYPMVNPMTPGFSNQQMEFQNAYLHQQYLQQPQIIHYSDPRYPQSYLQNNRSFSRFDQHSDFKHYDQEYYRSSEKKKKKKKQKHKLAKGEKNPEEEGSTKKTLDESVSKSFQEDSAVTPKAANDNSLNEIEALGSNRSAQKPKKKYSSLLNKDLQNPETREQLKQVLKMKDDIKKEFSLVKQELKNNEDTLEHKIEDLKHQIEEDKKEKQLIEQEIEALRQDLSKPNFSQIEFEASQIAGEQEIIQRDQKKKQILDRLNKNLKLYIHNSKVQSTNHPLNSLIPIVQTKGEVQTKRFKVGKEIQVINEQNKKRLKILKNQNNDHQFGLNSNFTAKLMKRLEEVVGNQNQSPQYK